jgi:hypothetical protein
VKTPNIPAESARVNEQRRRQSDIPDSLSPRSIYIKSVGICRIALDNLNLQCITPQQAERYAMEKSLFSTSDLTGGAVQRQWSDARAQIQLAQHTASGTLTVKAPR